MHVKTENRKNGTKKGYVLFVKSLLKQISTLIKKLAQEVAVLFFGKVVSVYDITVDTDHEFFANNVLVHNCSDNDDYFLCQYFSSEFARYQSGPIKKPLAGGFRKRFK